MTSDGVWEFLFYSFQQVGRNCWAISSSSNTLSAESSWFTGEARKGTQRQTIAIVMNFVTRHATCQVRRGVWASSVNQSAAWRQQDTRCEVKIIKWNNHNAHTKKLDISGARGSDLIVAVSCSSYKCLRMGYTMRQKNQSANSELCEVIFSTRDIKLLTKRKIEGTRTWVQQKCDEEEEETTEVTPSG